MSRRRGLYGPLRRGEFEHRTTIFEGAFRAWSHLGGLEPADLETKPASDLDPLNFPLENDARLAAQREKESKKAPPGDGTGGMKGMKMKGDAEGGPRREYPYEPLPRSGLAHPFVQAILSLWLGPDADQDAIQLGLTTLRTWWQHRRMGESGSAIVALGTDKMRGVVEGYTRHFFNLAHCLIVNVKKQPPRTLHGKRRDLEKSRKKKGKLTVVARENAAAQQKTPSAASKDNEDKNKASKDEGAVVPGRHDGDKRKDDRSTTSKGDVIFHNYEERVGRSKRAFLMNLTRMLESVEDMGKSHIVRWTEEGNGFIIVDSELFMSDIVPKFFQWSKDDARIGSLRSFHRKLNRWGFNMVNGREMMVNRRNNETSQLESRWYREDFDRHSALSAMKEALEKKVDMDTVLMRNALREVSEALEKSKDNIDACDAAYDAASGKIPKSGDMHIARPAADQHNMMFLHADNMQRLQEASLWSSMHHNFPLVQQQSPVLPVAEQHNLMLLRANMQRLQDDPLRSSMNHNLALMQQQSHLSQLPMMQQNIMAIPLSNALSMNHNNVSAQQQELLLQLPATQKTPQLPVMQQKFIAIPPINDFSMNHNHALAQQQSPLQSHFHLPAMQQNTSENANVPAPGLNGTPKQPSEEDKHTENPMKNIEEGCISHNVDILFGTSNESGNKCLRALAKKRLVMSLTKKDKSSLLATGIVHDVRSRGGRFLEKDPITNLWNDLSDKRAVAKTLQVLREMIEPDMEGQTAIIKGATLNAADRAITNVLQSSAERKIQALLEKRNSANAKVHSLQAPQEEMPDVDGNKVINGKKWIKPDERWTFL